MTGRSFGWIAALSGGCWWFPTKDHHHDGTSTDTGTDETVDTGVVVGDPEHSGDSAVTGESGHSGDVHTGTPPGVLFVPRDLTIPPPELAGESAFCWTMSDRGLAALWTAAVGVDTGTVVEIDSWPSVSVPPATSLVAYGDTLVAARSPVWLGIDLWDGLWTSGRALDGVYGPGLAVLGSDLVAVSGDELRLFPTFDDLVWGRESEARPGFSGLEAFTSDGSILYATELTPLNLRTVDPSDGAVLSSVPLALTDVHVDGLSFLDGVVYVLDSDLTPARVLALDATTGALLSDVELVGAVAPFDPGGLACLPTP